MTRPPIETHVEIANLSGPEAALGYDGESSEHTVNVYELDGEIFAHQINNAVQLPHGFMSTAEDILGDEEVSSFNLKAGALQRFREGDTPTADDVVLHPVSTIFLSSQGLLNGSEWTSNQPSEGIAVLSEWLARNEPEAAPIFIDPNLLSEQQLKEILLRYTEAGRLALVGFSLLPVNILNDARLVTSVKETVPDSLVVAGGIGSEILDLLPTKTGKQGISEALPVDLTLQGSPFRSLASIVRGIRDGSVIDGPSLRALVHDLDNPGYTEDPHEVFAEALQARETARKWFIPYKRNDKVHGTNYAAANGGTEQTDGTADVVSVLIDNRCDQGCYFCASPKQQMFVGVGDAIEHVIEKAADADVIAFNDNDLSNNPEQTIALCEAMVQEGVLQPKHGKMRANTYEPRLLEALAAAGFTRIALGIESFDVEVRNGLSKRDFTDEIIAQNLVKLLELGITPEINLILFSPRETQTSLKTTTEQALEWSEKGCLLYATMGLFATPNSPAVKSLLERNALANSQRVETTEINLPGMSDALIFPTQWKVPQEVVGIKDQLLQERPILVKEVGAKLGVQVSVPIEAYIGMALLAHYTKVDGFTTEGEMKTKIFEYATKMASEPYISI